MKKILSISLILCMLLALCAPLTVSAAYVTPAATEVQNVSDLFDRASNTGLDAYKGTPDMTETTGSIKDAEWDKALPLELNNLTKGKIVNATFGTLDAEFYLLWDENYLYILQVADNSTIKANNADVQAMKNSSSDWTPWSSKYTCTIYNAVLPSAISDASAYAIGVLPNGTVANTGDIAEAVVRVRYYDLPNGNYTNPSSKPYMTYAESNEFKTAGEATATAGKHLYARTQKTETGYMTETRISWAFLNHRDATAFTPDTTGFTTEIGLKINGAQTNGGHGGSHINHTGVATAEGTEVNADIAGWDSVSLLNTKPTRTSVPTITPDTAYWAEALASTATEFEIATAERLYGLGHYLCSSGSDTDYGANNITYGKTFKLTADIDLNPGMNVAALAQADSLGYWEMPNVWPTLDGFAGTFDGQGHMISGIYYGGIAPVSRQYSGFGFIARWYAGGDVKNLVFDNVYVYAPNCADGVGLIAGIRSHNTTDDKVSKIENVYVGANVLISAEDNTGTQRIGGLVGDSWASQQGLSLEISNVTFAGTILAGTAASGAIIGRIQVHAISVSDFVFYRTAGSVGKFVTTFSNNGTLNGKATELAAKDEMPRTKILQSEQDEAAFLAEADPYVVQTELGVMPVKLADMMANYKWQSTEASTDGKFSVRIVAEVASMKYDAVGFKVQLYKNGQADAFHGNLSNTVVYDAVIADGQNVTAAAFNDGFMDGTDNKLFVITIDDLTAADTWTVEVTAVYKIGETTIESAIAKTTAVSAAQ